MPTANVKGRDSRARHARQRKPAAVEHQVMAFRLRVDRGASFTEIAEALHISRSTAHEAFHRELAAVRELVSEDEAREAVLLQCARLDRAFQVASTIASSSPNPDVKLRAIDRIIRIEERRAKLLGLDAPNRTLLGVTIEREEMTPEEEAAELVAFGMPAAIAIAKGPEAIEAPAEGDPPGFAPPTRPAWGRTACDCPPAVQRFAHRGPLRPDPWRHRIALRGRSWRGRSEDA
ncbi:MAG: hypothetical protein ACLP4R_14040 [Solirubrobacteraceae bacterium]